jgi:hypothetical protein
VFIDAGTKQTFSIAVIPTQESLFLFTKPSGNLACSACPDARR